MRNLRHILTTVLLLAFSILGFAKDNASIADKYSDAKAEMKKLTEEGEKKVQEIKRLQLQLHNDTMRLCQEYNRKLSIAQSDSVKDQVLHEKALADTVERLHELSKDLSDRIDSFEKAKVQLQRLRNDTLNLANRKRGLESSLALVKLNLTQLEGDLARLLPFREELERSTILLKVKEWDNLCFSRLDSDSLAMVFNNCQNLTEPEFVKAKEKLNDIINGKSVYDAGQELIESPFDGDERKKVRTQLRELISRYKGKPPHDGLKNLEENVDNYIYCVEFFQEIISSVKRNDVAVGAIDSEFNDYIVEINKIPYLKTRFKEYLDNLGTNQSEASKIETEIMTAIK